MHTHKMTPMIHLEGAERNAFVLITRATEAMLDLKWDARKIYAFRREARYYDVLRYPTDATPVELLEHVRKVVGWYCLIWNAPAGRYTLPVNWTNN